MQPNMTSEVTCVGVKRETHVHEKAPEARVDDSTILKNIFEQVFIDLGVSAGPDLENPQVFLVLLKDVWGNQVGQNIEQVFDSQTDDLGPEHGDTFWQQWLRSDLCSCHHTSGGAAIHFLLHFDSS